MSDLKKLLGKEYYEELKTQQLLNKVRKGGYMPPLYDWLKEVNPNYNWDWPFQSYAIKKLQDFTDGKIDKLMVFTSPRIGKSQLISVHYPAYLLERNPTDRIILATYNQTLANKMSRAVRSLSRTRIPLDPERAAMEEWDTKEGGGLRAVGVGAGVTGVGGNTIIIDDPVRSRKDASSPTIRRTTWEWYQDDLRTRLEPDGRIVILMTRWHEQDLCGMLLEQEPELWDVVRLPALAEENDPLGRKVGESINPERFSREALLEIKKTMGRSFYALYQQRPQEQEGDFFKGSWFQKLDNLPELEQGEKYEFVRFWDKAATVEDRSDYTVGVLMCKNRKTGYYYIVDVVRGKWNPHSRDKVILRTAQQDQELYGHVRIFHEEEPGSSGKDAAKQTNQLLSGYSVKAIKSTGNKQLRAEPYQSQCEAQNIFLIKAQWNADFIDEHATFPLGGHDDIVDASAGAFSQLTKGKGFISFGDRFR